MIEYISGFFSVLKKLNPVFFLGLSIATGAVIFLPENTISIIGLDDFRSLNKGYIGGVFIIAVSLLIAQAVFWCLKSIVGIYKRKQVSKVQKDYLHNLTPDEKAYLKPFVIEEKNTQYFGIQDGIAGGLDAKGILYRSSNVGNILAGIAYNMQPWAKKHLRDNLNLLEGANPLLPSDQKIRMR